MLLFLLKLLFLFGCLFLTALLCVHMLIIKGNK